MKLSKAKEILEIVHDTPPSGASQDFKDAIQLGIEALKRIKKESAFPYTLPYPLLPGEDPE